MDAATISILTIAGMAGGLVNALAGGATLITFPAMLHAGLPPVAANASNTVAIMPGHLVAALADHARLPRFDRRAWMLIAASVAGGGVGASILTSFSEEAFTRPIPALIAFATLLFATAPRLQAWAASRPRFAENSRGFATAALALASVYGGFFGAGLGVILTAVLSITEDVDLRSVKVLKNLLATTVSLSATATLVVEGAVRWPQTLVMMGGALVGGFVGGTLIRVLPATWVRRFVIASGAVMSALYAKRYWL